MNATAAKGAYMRTETPAQMAERVLAAYVPTVAANLRRVASAGHTIDRDAVAVWLVVNGPDIYDTLRRNRRFVLVPDDELDAIVTVCAEASAHLPEGADVEFVAEFAHHVATERAKELASAPNRMPTRESGGRRLVEVAKAVWSWNPTRGKTTGAKPRRRTVVTCRDLLDGRGNVAVPEGMVGVAVDWPMFGAVTVKFTNRHGQTFQASVYRSDLAVVDP